MKIESGKLYFIKDEFFNLVKEPFLKINYDTSKRPHYFTIKDPDTNLLWVVPCSSKVEKFERLVQKKKELGKPTDTIKIVKILDAKTVLLYQDMFPILEKYIYSPYIKGGQLVGLSDPKKIAELNNNASKVIKLLRHGIKFTPTQPDAIRIEGIMLNESQRSCSLSSFSKPSIREKLKPSKALITETNEFRNPPIKKIKDLER